MASEITVRTSLEINGTVLKARPQPTSFIADMSEQRGPTPGLVAVTVSGVNVDLSALTAPGMCRIMNLDATSWVEYGVYDPETTKFYPLGEVGPGETYVLRLSRHIGVELGPTGTGTSGPTTNRLRIKGLSAACDVVVEAFGK